ncbi:39S ribosomal protein L41-B, mitochondrial-like [Selaginella moellendorffii]|uniref:39S ribosomal protein L41-B, mitochondrial-like n=1 Tax=Selaginella moellendorffii TaxID=88036 RepID=UPI000D1C6797|nr:39S ribosomal protein L41-B, mitochondrial-like [Selaginella moellendorffii]|eukprot:XP_024544221.1 39S ribosomal protein L41-B, mitochondrial-like [Selaginella moellendorffii]
MPLGVLTGFLRARRVPKKGFLSLSPKRAEKNYYKGKGVINYGRLTKKGGFSVLLHKLPKFVVPDLTGFKLKPYVAHNVPKIVSKEKLEKEKASAGI